MGLNSCILVISDTQHPSEHEDFLAFLKAVVKKHKPTRAIHIGDEDDNNPLSDYGLDPDMDNDGTALFKVRHGFRQLYQMFPKLQLIVSNHLIRYYKRAKKAGLSQERLVPLAKLYRTPKWTWHKNLILKLKYVGNVCFQHGHQGDAYIRACHLGMSVVSGHSHSKAYIRFFRTASGELRYAVQTGCLINDRSAAFDYNKDDKEKPVFSLVVIKDGIPRFEIMLIDKNDRWIGHLTP